MHLWHKWILSEDKRCRSCEKCDRVEVLVFNKWKKRHVWIELKSPF